MSELEIIVEKRNRYILSEEELKKLQMIELELLVEFDRICRRHEIAYSIDGGTLLGAVRHEGFIPWDDDADVIMTRSEYCKFIEVSHLELDKERFYLQDMNNTTGYRWGYAKMRRKGTEFIRLNQEHMPYEQGVFMDIFICDNVPNNYILRSICNFISYLYRKFFWSAVGKESERGLQKVIYKILYRIPEKTLKESYCKFVAKCNKSKSAWVKCLTFPACNKTLGYKREWYEDTEDIIFEGITLKAARKYDEYLKFLYGDYMELPPVEERKVHPISKIVLLDEGEYRDEQINV